MKFTSEEVREVLDTAKYCDNLGEKGHAMYILFLEAFAELLEAIKHGKQHDSYPECRFCLNAKDEILEAAGLE